MRWEPIARLGPRKGAEYRGHGRSFHLERGPTPRIATELDRCTKRAWLTASSNADGSRARVCAVSRRTAEGIRGDRRDQLGAASAKQGAAHRMKSCFAHICHESAGGSGKYATDCGRYSYASRWPEIQPPIFGTSRWK